MITNRLTTKVQLCFKKHHRNKHDDDFLKQGLNELNGFFCQRELSSRKSILLNRSIRLIVPKELVVQEKPFATNVANVASIFFWTVTSQRNYGWQSPHNCCIRSFNLTSCGLDCACQKCCPCAWSGRNCCRTKFPS